MINKIYESYETLKYVSLGNILDKITLDLYNLDDNFLEKKICKSILSEITVMRPFNDKKFFELNPKIQMTIYILINISSNIHNMSDEQLNNTFIETFTNSLDGKYNEIETIHNITSNLIELCS